MENNNILTVGNAIPSITSFIENDRIKKTFVRCLQSFGYVKPEQDIMDFFKMVLKDPNQFKLKSNYPDTWVADAAFVSGLSAISKACDCPCIKELLVNDYQGTKRMLNKLSGEFKDKEKNKNEKEGRMSGGGEYEGRSNSSSYEGSISSDEDNDKLNVKEIKDYMVAVLAEQRILIEEYRESSDMVKSNLNTMKSHYEHVIEDLKKRNHRLVESVALLTSLLKI